MQASDQPDSSSPARKKYAGIRIHRRFVPGDRQPQIVPPALENGRAWNLLALSHARPACTHCPIIFASTPGRALPGARGTDASGTQKNIPYFSGVDHARCRACPFRGCASPTSTGVHGSPTLRSWLHALRVRKHCLFTRANACLLETRLRCIYAQSFALDRKEVFLC